jgi:predicted RNA-binding protein with PIN domain
MQYLIDGHNLIPFIPGISLKDIDDEDQLINLLQIHGRVSRSRIEVFFDKAPSGKPRTRKVGLVTVHSIPEPETADSAIIRRVKSQKFAPGSLSVVSHDREVQTACRRMGAKIIESLDFSRSIQSSLRSGEKREKEQPEVDKAEVEAWLKVFEGEKTSEKNQD